MTHITFSLYNINRYYKIQLYNIGPVLFNLPQVNWNTSNVRFMANINWNLRLYPFSWLNYMTRTFCKMLDFSKRFYYIGNSIHCLWIYSTRANEICKTINRCEPKEKYMICFRTFVVFISTAWNCLGSSILPNKHLS